MKTYVEVENFGKIRHAKVSSNGFTVFVGDNNSGKSYLMQLIYAISKNFPIEDMEGEFIKTLQSRLDEGNRVFYLQNDEISLLVDDVNRYLDMVKEKLVRRIFRKSIPIGKIKLYLDIDKSEKVKISIQESNVNIRGPKQSSSIFDGQLKSVYIHVGKKSFSYFADVIKTKFLAGAVFSTIFGNYGTLYLPAARAGIQLLYRDFFASRTDELFYAQNDKREDIQLTEPIYDYLRFLQMVSTRINIAEEDAKLIGFIEEHIIDGHISISEKNEISYSQMNGAQNVPLYIASSMIAEVTPIVECILDGFPHDFLIIDEIEASLHPKKQRELARLLNRMRNAGIDILISTHSDSMAAYINNLLIASMKQLGEEKLNRLNLTKEDLLLDTDVHFYEFRNNEDCSSYVEELQVQTYPNEGVQFSMFNQNIDQLYRESTSLLEVPNEATGEKV